MVRVHKRASKRVSTKQKSKIIKKVREHHRKSKKQAKKDPTWKSKKKVDPGIPNSYPYKEQLLNEIEQKRIAAEAAKREARERLNGKDIEEAPEAEMSDIGFDNFTQNNGTRIRLPTPAAAVHKMYKGTLIAFYDSDDRIATLMLVDARDPGTWTLEDLEKQLRTRKETPIIVLTKCDLVPLEVIAAWSAHLSSLGLGQVFPFCSHEAAKQGQKLRKGGGLAKLVSHIENLCSDQSKSKSGKAGQTVALVGYENSGRTSLARELASALPKLTILDTPSLVAASSRVAHPEERIEEEEDQSDAEEANSTRDQEAAHRILIRNSGSIFKIKEPLPLVDALLKRVSQVSDLMVTFNVAAFSDLDGFLIGVARMQGRLKKGAVPDTIAACRHILRGWSDGEIGYYSKPPSDVTGVEEARKAIESDSSLKGVCLHRREWRQKWSGKELRLTTGSKCMFGAARLAFSRSTDHMEEDSDDDSGDEDEDDEGEDDDEEEAGVTDEELLDSDPDADTSEDPQEESEAED